MSKADCEHNKIVREILNEVSNILIGDGSISVDDLHIAQSEASKRIPPILSRTRTVEEIEEALEACDIQNVFGSELVSVMELRKRLNL